MQSLARPWLGLTAIVVGASALLAIGTLRVREWVVQTDEMLYTKLARHMGETGSPLPTLHGEHVGFLGVVYPIVLAPFYGGLDNVSAFTPPTSSTPCCSRARRSPPTCSRGGWCRRAARWSSRCSASRCPGP